MAMISDRSAEVVDRVVSGYWEGDPVMGASSRSALGTPAERSIRFVILLHLPDGKSAGHVERAMRSKIETPPLNTRFGQTTQASASTVRSAAAPTASASSPTVTRSPNSSAPSSPNKPTNGPKDAATSASTSWPKAASHLCPTLQAR